MQHKRRIRTLCTRCSHCRARAGIRGEACFLNAKLVRTASQTASPASLRSPFVRRPRRQRACGRKGEWCTAALVIGCHGKQVARHLASRKLDVVYPTLMPGFMRRKLRPNEVKR
eukprot:6197739-Pleurochrysis_carterae.AAC.5